MAEPDCDDCALWDDIEREPRVSLSRQWDEWDPSSFASDVTCQLATPAANPLVLTGRDPAGGHQLHLWLYDRIDGNRTLLYTVNFTLDSDQPFAWTLLLCGSGIRCE